MSVKVADIDKRVCDQGAQIEAVSRACGGIGRDVIGHDQRLTDSDGALEDMRANIALLQKGLVSNATGPLSAFARACPLFFFC